MPEGRIANDERWDSNPKGGIANAGGESRRCQRAEAIVFKGRNTGLFILEII